MTLGRVKYNFWYINYLDLFPALHWEITQKMKALAEDLRSTPGICPSTSTYIVWQLFSNIVTSIVTVVAIRVRKVRVPLAEGLGSHGPQTPAP